MRRPAWGLADEASGDAQAVKLHGFVLEGQAPYGTGSESQEAALAIAALSGMPVVRVGRADPGGRVPDRGPSVVIAGSNLDANKARMLLMASMMKLGRLPRAADPRKPTRRERDATIAKVTEYQAIFDSH